MSYAAVLSVGNGGKKLRLKVLGNPKRGSSLLVIPKIYLGGGGGY